MPFKKPGPRPKKKSTPSKKKNSALRYMTCDYCGGRVCINIGGWVILGNKKTLCADCYKNGIEKVF